MKAPRTPRPSTAGASAAKTAGPRTPSANRLAQAERGAVAERVERGEAAPVEAPFAQSARAWRSGGDRKIMFDNRGGAALIPEALRPMALVAILHICSWLLLATGVFQIVVSKLGDFKYPIHWVGALMLLLGLVTIMVRVYTNRCGTKPEWAGVIAVITLVVCLSSWLLADGPLYDKVKEAERCTDENVFERCGIEKAWDDDFSKENLKDPNVCICQVASGGWDLCVDFTADCEYIPSNRRYLLMSLATLWVGLGLSFIVAVVSMRVATTTHDAGAIAAAREKKKLKDKMKNESTAPTVPFGPTSAPFGDMK